jgi:putative RecB family exonuclease
MSEDFKLSVSKSKTFLQCKKQYQFNYILSFPKKQRDYHITGKFSHKVLEEFHLFYINGCQEPFHIKMKDAWKIAWAEFKDQMTPEMKKECWTIINGYLKKISGESKFNVLSAEKTFEILIDENIILRGAIDKISLDENNMIVVSDYKTTKNKSYLVNDFFQLATYGFVLFNENPDLKEIKGSYILLRHNGEEISKVFTVKDFLDVKVKIIDYAHQMINEKDFKASPSALCNFCDFQEFCPEGKAKAFGKQVFGEVAY